MIMGSFARIATETVHDHEVTRAGRANAGRIPKRLMPLRSRGISVTGDTCCRVTFCGVDAAFMLVEQRESGIHAF